MKCGFVTLVGRPNVGKSSLLNNILGQKIAITSKTPQTTRDVIKGIYNSQEGQIVFIDTPGVHKPKQKFGELLNKNAIQARTGSDLIFFLTPIDEEILSGDEMIIESLDLSRSIALITKIDLGDEKQAKKKAETLKKYGFKDVLGVSTSMQDSVKHFTNYVFNNLPEGAPFYEGDMVADLSLRFMAKEFIRESALENTFDEVPHALAVEITDFIEERSIYKIYGTIYVEKESQKGILIGKNGSLIKKIGSSARKQMESEFQIKIFLALKVKVNKNWTKDQKTFKKLGY